MELRYSNSSKLFSSIQIKKYEEEYCSRHGVSVLELMQRAGEQVAAYINEEFTDFLESELEIHILSGPGNNGGDGVVVARSLHEMGFKASLFIITSEKYSHEMQSQIEGAMAIGLNFKFIDSIDSSDGSRICADSMRALLPKAALVLDCLLGTGQRGEPRGLIAECVKALNAAKTVNPDLKIISIDVPTGYNCDSGAIYNLKISPDITLVLQYLKLGLVQSPALENLGKLEILDFGLDLSENKNNYNLITSADLLTRARDCHKGDFGHVLLVAGSDSMPGAGLLSAHACLRAGAGLATLATTSSSFASIQSSYVPELMYHLCNADLSIAASSIVNHLDLYSALLIGPGLGKGERQTGFVFHLLRETNLRNIPCVLDADGLSALAELKKMSVPLSLSNVIITPHLGEASRLLGISTNEIRENRYAAAEALVNEFSCSVILKGPSTICLSKDVGTVNSSGGPFLATAGSGDVLAGILAAFLAQGYDQIRSASNAAFIHGLAGELAHAQHSGPILASDIISQIPFALGKAGYAYS